MTPPADDAAPDMTNWDLPNPEEGPGEGEALRVDLDGFEGPLDLLLALARLHKVDVARISMLALADQYLAFISEASRIRLELAADYLVMAAWLAYLKSRLLIPKERPDDPLPSGEEMAKRLAFRLMRLEAMRKAAEQLMGRHRLGIHVFARGMPEGMRTIRATEHTAEIYDLIKAYADQRSRTIKRVHVVKARTVWSIKDARGRLEELVGATEGEWVQLSLFLDKYLPSPDALKTVLASAFGATLELAREGALEVQQEAPFAPLFIRRRGSEAWVRVA
ncbi:MAG: segregation and condensation protein A [Hyphomicrobiaceae bacterium]